MYPYRHRRCSSCGFKAPRHELLKGLCARCRYLGVVRYLSAS
jgi:hypothetical protein